MIDRFAIAWLRPGFDLAAGKLASAGIGADQVTVAGFAIGIAGSAAIALGHFTIGLIGLLLGRICDGIDGSLARATRPTDRGAFLDITLDFVFYASVPLAFALADPDANALAAAVLLTGFVGTASSFLAFATIAAQRGLKSDAFPSKGIYYLGGLAEATETIVVFVVMCLWPQHFAAVAYVFASLCLITTATRVAAGRRAFTR